MATRTYYGKAVSGNDYVNNGATVVAGGNIGANAPVTNVPTTAQVLGWSGVGHGSSVASGDYTGAMKVLAAGNFALMTAGAYVIRRNCSALAGVSNTSLQSGGNAAGAHHSIHFNTTRSTVMIEYWIYESGTPVYESTNPSGCDFGGDHATTPTLALPGELAYMVKGTVATTGFYAARTHG
jgi:hypothetical protein